MQKILRCLTLWNICRYYSGIALLTFTLATRAGYAQDAAPPAQGVPSSPSNSHSSDDLKSLMVEAWKANGLASDAGLSPWHLKASFRILDEQGAVADQGTYEEFWVSATHFKQSYASSKFTQTDYGTEKGILRTGEPKWAPYLLQQIRHALVDPLPGESELEGARLMSEEHRGAQGGGTRCVRKLNKPRDASGHATLSTYCFLGETDKLQMSLTGIGNDQIFPFFRITRKQAVSFEGRLVPSDFEVAVNTSLKASLSVHLDVMEQISAIREADFASPASAVAPPEVAQVDAGVVSVAGPVLLHFGEPQANAAAISMTAASKLLVKNPEPVIPPAALAARVSGPVILQATVGKDGTVVEAEVTSGREMLQQAALDLVRQRVYQPYLVNGAPVPFQTTIVVVFKLPDSAEK